MARKKITYVLLVLIIVLGYFLYRNKDLVLAGMINGKPVFVWELNSRMKKRYGAQIFDELANERLIKEAAIKNNKTVTEKEIETKLKEVEKSLKGQGTLAEVLKQQGLTENEFKNQIELRLLVEKFISDKAKVTDKEIQDYIAKNEETLKTAQATDSASWGKYARDVLQSQKMSEAFEKWFTELKNKAKIEKFF